MGSRCPFENMRLPIGGNTRCRCGTSRSPSTVTSCRKASSALPKTLPAVAPPGLRLAPASVGSARRATRRCAITRRSASSPKSGASSKLARSPKASRATVAYGCLVSQRPPAQSTIKASRRLQTSSVGTSQDNLLLHVPWSMRQGRAPRAYSDAKREPEASKAGATCMLSKRSLLILGAGVEPARACGALCAGDCAGACTAGSAVG
mmetsp:Transcript_49237/g.86662  ORF Transcript_49237/g.86662 Transcript_49237/m.86662 type:complete len:206 (+) Transcript_49237:62-679(+)